MRSRSRLFPPTRPAFARLLRDRRGSTIGIMAAGLLVGIGSLGSAIDAGRMYIVKSQLQAGVDAAALAGARAFGVTDTSANSRAKQVDSYFDGNFPRSPAYMGTTNVTVVPTFAVVNGVNVTTVNAAATLDMSFMRLFGFREVTMRAVAKAELQPRTLEVMVVMDNTGSMADTLSAGKTRIQALKDAANSFVDILFQGGTQRKDLALGFIPYDITVNVGRLLEAARPDSVAKVEGFNSGVATDWGSWPSNTFAWKGCVMNDSTIRDVSADRLVSEPNAWDVTRTLPGEGTNPKVQPYFVPPFYLPSVADPNSHIPDPALTVNPSSTYYQLPSGYDQTRNNMFKFDRSVGGASGGTLLANSAAYRSYMYDYYIGLNGDGASGKDNDVIRLKSDTDPGGYYNPSSGDRATTNWYVDWTRIPNYLTNNYWRDLPNSSSVVSTGGSTPGQSPNWQCPEEAMPPLYNRTKNEYTNYIKDKNAAIKPANGTIHHTGLLWAYRLLVRDDVFTRPRPSGTTNEPPRRAIVFMTDGLNEIGESQNNYLNRTFTWYGRWSDLTISSKSDKAEEQMLRRFEKTCANIQREANPPQVYIIALVANSAAIDTAFNNCAPGRVYRTSSASQLNAAFQNVAAELVDLHLTQ
jgi:Flp pilus assembly protein TadG